MSQSAASAAARLARKLDKFQQHRRDMERRARELSMLEEHEAEHRRLMNHDETLACERRKKKLASEWEDAHQQRWEESLRSRYQREEEDAKFRKSRAAAAREAVRRMRKAAARDLSATIRDFEDRLGSAMDVPEDESSLEGGSLMEAMRRSKAVGNAARERSDEWRRQVMVTIEEADKSRMTENWTRRMEDCAVRKNCRAEDELKRTVFDKMRAYEHYLQKSASLRLARIWKYEEERKEMLEGREMVLVGEALRSFKLRMDDHRRQYRMLKRQARACGSSRACDMVEAILEQMLCLAVSAVHHRGVIDAGDSFMEEDTWRGWKRVFVEGLFLENRRANTHVLALDSIVSPPEVNVIEEGVREETMQQLGGMPITVSERMKVHGQTTTEGEDQLDRMDVDDYIKGRGKAWLLSPEQASASRYVLKTALTEVFVGGDEDPVAVALWKDIEDEEQQEGNPRSDLVNNRLAALVEFVCRTLYPEKLTKEDVALLPMCGIRVLLGGKYLSGRRTLARGLKQRYPNMSIIDVDELVAECIDRERRIDGLEYCRQKTMDATVNGSCISDDVYVDMIVAKLNDVFAEEMAESPGTGPENIRGWVLIGFPNDERQLTMLSRRLAGVVPPDHLDVHDSLLDRVLDFAGSPRPSAMAHKHDCGYDLRAVIDVPNEELSRRALGRLVDQDTGVVFHIQANPPPIVAEAVRRAPPEVAALVRDLGGESGTNMLRDQVLPLDASLAPPAAASHESMRMSPKRQGYRMSFGRTHLYDDPIYPTSTLPHLYHALDEREEALERASAAMGRPTLRIPSGTRDEVLDRLCEAVEKVRLDREGTEVSKEEEEAPQVAEAPSVFSLVEALKKVDVCTILYLAQEWESAVVGPKGSDEQYRQAFRWIRQCKDCLRRGLADIRSLVIQRLEMVDGRQSVVNSFIADFNAFTEEYSDMCRENEETKDELHARVDDVCERLVVEFVHKKIEAATELRKQIMATRWSEAVLTSMAAAVQALFRAEYARYYYACLLLCDAYSLVLPSEHGGPVLHELSDGEQLQGIDVLGVDDETIATNQEKVRAFLDEAACGEGADGGRTEVLETPEVIWTACEVRKYTVSEGDDGEARGGEWTFPFIDKLEEAVRRASEAAPAQLSAWKDPSKLADPVPDPKAAKGGKKGGAARQEPIEVAPPPEAYIDYQRAVLEEKVILSTRLTVLKRWATELMMEANDSVENTLAEAERWISLRGEVEMGTIKEFGNKMKSHIEVAGVPRIPCHYTLLPTLVMMHENVLLRAPIGEPSD